MTTKQLYQNYQKELKKLQKECKHTKVTDWLHEQWVPGHSSGSTVKMCKKCDKIIRRIADRSTGITGIDSVAISVQPYIIST